MWFIRNEGLDYCQRNIPIISGQVLDENSVWSHRALFLTQKGGRWCGIETDASAYKPTRAEETGQCSLLLQVAFSNTQHWISPVASQMYDCWGYSSVQKNCLLTLASCWENLTCQAALVVKIIWLLQWWLTHSFGSGNNFYGVERPLDLFDGFLPYPVPAGGPLKWQIDLLTYSKQQ